MKRPRKDARNKQIVELRSRGYAFSEIAKTFGLNRTTVADICQKYAIFEGKVMRKSEAFLSNAFRHMNDLKRDAFVSGKHKEPDRKTLIHSKLGLVVQSLSDYELALWEDC